MLPEWENADKAGRPVVSFTTKGRRLKHGDSYIIIDQCYVQYIPPTPAAPKQAAGSFQPEQLAHRLARSAWRSESPPPPMFGSSTPPRSFSPMRAPPRVIQTTTKRPILFLHGGCLTSSVWESTPDRRPGWAIRASQAGHPVYLLDTIDSGRSARPPDGCREGALMHRTAKHVWERFRIGPFGSWNGTDTPGVTPIEPKEGMFNLDGNGADQGALNPKPKPFDNTQFPTDSLDMLIAMQVDKRYGSDEIELQGVKDAIKEIGECDIIAHSRGALVFLRAFAEDEVLQDVVKKVFLVEPGTPVPERGEMKNLRRRMEDMTIVWCDHLNTHGLWTMLVTEWEGVLKEAGVIRLTDLDINGNSHLPMCDRNSDEVVELLLERLSPRKEY